MRWMSEDQNSTGQGITNTAEQIRKDPAVGLGFLAGFNTIEQQEENGQREFIKSDLLPVKLLGQEKQFEALGFTLGPQVESDKLFRHVILPQGWRRQATDHPMWTDIVDGDGCRRVAVFYKAAFYDRKATASLVARYSIECVDEEAERWIVYDCKLKKPVFEPDDGARDACVDWKEARPRKTLIEEWSEP